MVKLAGNPISILFQQRSGQKLIHKQYLINTHNKVTSMEKLLNSSVFVFLINHKVQAAILLLIAAYFGTLDIWGDEWSFIKEYRDIHACIYITCIIFEVVLFIVRAYIDNQVELQNQEYTSFLEGFIKFTSKIVHTKSKRFKKTSKKLNPNADIFQAITKPVTQIEKIAEETCNLLKGNFVEENEQVSVSVFGKHPGKEWYRLALEGANKGKNTDVAVLFGTESAAKYCYEDGNPVYFNDKNIAADEGRYHLSERDRRHITGSIYCYPVMVDTPDGMNHYVISIVTYGKKLCEKDERKQVEAVKTFMKEICRRIELELTLHSIMLWSNRKGG